MTINSSNLNGCWAVKIVNKTTFYSTEWSAIQNSNVKALYLDAASSPRYSNEWSAIQNSQIEALYIGDSSKPTYSNEWSAIQNSNIKALSI